MMKHIAIAVALVALVCLSGAALADISPHMSYQGVLKDDLGNAVPDGTYDVTFKLYEAASGGTEIWTETQSLPVEGGIMNVLLGSVVSLTTLSWEVPYWLGISVEGETELDPRTELTTVAYAAHAGFADTAGDDADWVISGDDMYSGVAGGVGIGDTTPEWLFDIHLPSPGINYMQMTNSSTGDALYSGLLMGVSGETGWISYSAPGALRLGRGSAYHSINIEPDGKVTVGLIEFPDAEMEVAGHFKTQSFEMPTGAFPGFVLTSDLNGVGTWQLNAAPAAAASAAGNAVLDANGEARVELPESLTAASDGLRYQLTCIGGFAPVYVAEKARGGVFTIAGGEPGMEVSWQVAGE